MSSHSGRRRDGGCARSPSSTPNGRHVRLAVMELEPEPEKPLAVEDTRFDLTWLVRIASAGRARSAPRTWRRSPRAPPGEKPARRDPARMRSHVTPTPSSWTATGSGCHAAAETGYRYSLAGSSLSPRRSRWRRFGRGCAGRSAPARGACSPRERDERVLRCKSGLRRRSAGPRASDGRPPLDGGTGHSRADVRRGASLLVDGRARSRVVPRGVRGTRDGVEHVRLRTSSSAVLDNPYARVWCLRGTRVSPITAAALRYARSVIQ